MLTLLLLVLAGAIWLAVWLDRRRAGRRFDPMRRYPSLLLLLPVLLALLALIWLLPSPGQLALMPADWESAHAWPRVQTGGDAWVAGSEREVRLYDTTPWPHVKLLVNGSEATLRRYPSGEAAALYEWVWDVRVPDGQTYQLAFYHHCQSGCQVWTTAVAGQPRPPAAPFPFRDHTPTKLGVVFADPQRNWHNRRGWAVELTYATEADAGWWGIDALAQRVQAAAGNGLHVLVRVDYAPGQSVPPPDDPLALAHYLAYLRRLAQDARLEGVYGYVIGSGFNAAGNNTLSPQNPVTPEWYGRVFSGYGLPPTRQDTALRTIRGVNPDVRVLVGPLSAWRTDQDGNLPWRIDLPWLNWFHTLVAVLDQAAQAQSAAGNPFGAPDGFALQAFGRPDLPEMAGRNSADEPLLDLHRPEWGQAQSGFRIYRDWLEIINSHPATRGLPVYITATNTHNFESDRSPAELYPPGWLTNALQEVNAQPQIRALCWFIDDFPHDDQWQWFRLGRARGLTIEASAEFDTLLRTAP